MDSSRSMIRAGLLSPPDRAALVALMRNESAAHGLTRRANAMLLLDDGLSREEVAKALYLDDDTVRGWAKLSGEGGLKGLPSGAYLYDPDEHALRLIAGADLRRVTGCQDFVDEVRVDQVFVADHARMKLVPAHLRGSYASVAAGAVSQNVYLFCASSGLATVLRAWIDRDAIADALGLNHDQQVLLS